TLKCGWA
ncbi:dsDNA-mimic protein, partial [Haemophilus influenzae]